MERTSARHMWRWMGMSLLAAIVQATPASAQGGAGLLGRPAHLDVREVTLADALAALQRTSGVALAYSVDLLPVEGRVTCRCLDSTVAAALDVLLEGTGLRYVERARQILVGPGAAAPNGREAIVSPGAVTGVVVDASSGRPVPSADVVLAPRGDRALTDGRGRFAIPAVPDGAYTLRISALGYQDARLDLVVPATSAFLRVALERAPIPLDEIVIAPGRLGVLDVTPAAMGNALSREDIEAIPEFGDDAFRTLARLPGVASGDISTKLHVRGSLDHDVLVRLDGMDLFEPYHLKEQDGALGIVDVQALGGIDLITGGFPPEFGDRLAGVLDMRTRTPPATGTRTTVGMSLSSLSFGNQGSFAGGRGQWLTSVRRGFLDIVLDITDSDDDLSPRYWDALGRLQYQVAPDHVVWVEVLHAGDDGRWADPNDTHSEVSSTWTNGYLWAGWKASLGDRVRAETIVSTGRLTRDRTGSILNSQDGVFTPAQASLRDKDSFDFGGVRQDWQVSLTEGLLLKAGFEARRMSGTYDYFSRAAFLDLDTDGRLFQRVDSTLVEESPGGTHTGAYLSARARTGPAFTWEAGLRYDRHTHIGDEEVSPRVLARVDLDNRTVLRGSWGRYHQSQGVQELSVADGETTFSPAERADQVALGLERRFGGGVTGRLEAYRRDVTDPFPQYLNLAREINPLLELESDRTRIAPTRSRARGVELSVQKEDESALSWAASYVLAETEDDVGGRWAPRTLDQRHTLNVMAAYRRGRSWQLSGLWQYHSGWPYTSQSFDVDVSQDAQGERYSIVRRSFGALNAENLPAYQRFDVRVTRAFDFDGSRLELFLDVFNVFGRINLRGYSNDLALNAGGDQLTVRRNGGERLLPRMPTLGFRWQF